VLLGDAGRFRGRQVRDAGNQQRRAELRKENKMQKKGFLSDVGVWRADGVIITEGDYMAGSGLDVALNSAPDEDELEGTQIGDDDNVDTQPVVVNS